MMNFVDKWDKRLDQHDFNGASNTENIGIFMEYVRESLLEIQYLHDRLRKLESHPSNIGPLA